MASLNHGWGYALKRPHATLAPLLDAVALSPAPFSTVEVFAPGTLTPLTLYSDAAATQPLANPFVADTYAFFSFYTASPAADVRISGTGIVIPYTIGNFLFDPGSTQYWNVKAFGAVGDGATDDFAALDNLANGIVGITCGGTLYFPEGTYRIGSNLTFPTNLVLLFDKCAILTPDAGVTVTILSMIDAQPFQIFDIAAAGSLITFRAAPIRSRTPRVWPDWWGCNGNNAPYDTDAVQAALNQELPVEFASNYYVTSVLWQTNPAGGVTEFIDGKGYFLIGVAAVPTVAVFQFNHSFAQLYNLGVNGNFNTNYGCGFQFLTTNTQNGPLFNEIIGLRILFALVGMAIGTPPPTFFGNGTPVYGTPGDCFTDLFISDCQICIYCNLPNSKFAFVNARMLVLETQWAANNPGVFDFVNSYCVWNEPNNGMAPPNDVGGGELYFYGGEVYNGAAPAGVGFGIRGCNLLFDGAIWEIAGQNLIEGSVGAFFSRVTLRNLMDCGNGNGTAPAFVTTITAVGQLLLENCFWNLSAGSAASSVGDLVDGRNSPNFTAIIANCEIMEWPWSYTSPGGSAFGRVVNGCRMIWRDSRYFTVAPGFSSNVQSNEFRPIFIGADGVGSTMSAILDQSNKNGWTWGGDATAGDQFGSESGDLPTFDVYPAAIQIESVGGGVSRITSPVGTSGFPIPTYANVGSMVMRGCIKTNATGTASIYVLFYRWDGTASVFPPAHVLGDDLTIPGMPYPSWTRFNARVDVPADAAFAAIELQTTDGGVMQITGLAM